MEGYVLLTGIVAVDLVALRSLWLAITCVCCDSRMK
jgi:hypothetical protein